MASEYASQRLSAILPKPDFYHGLIGRLERRFPERVRYHGRLSGNQLLSLMGGAHAVLCMSRADNLPNVAIEAMSLGTPVIGTRGASIDELVTDGEAGFLVSLEANEIADAIRRSTTLPADDLARMSRAARDHISEVLDAGRQIRALLEFYDSVAGGSVREPRSRSATAKLVRADLNALLPLFRKHGFRAAARNRLLRRLRAWGRDRA